MDLMIDLETLGTKPQSPIISIGAVFFDIERGMLGNTFYMALKIKDQLEKGRKIDADTLQWWFEQSDAAKKVFHEKAQPTATVLNTFTQWVKTNKGTSKVYPWGNGSTFDISLMEDIFNQYEIGCPWGFNTIMDLRTFRRFIAKGAPVYNGGTAHNALDDAIAQANYVICHSNQKPETLVGRTGAIV